MKYFWFIALMHLEQLKWNYTENHTKVQTMINMCILHITHMLGSWVGLGGFF